MRCRSSFGKVLLLGWCLILVSAADPINSSTLKLVQILFRHGDRNPIDPFPTSPYKDERFWPEGFGQLTKIGKMQQYEVGQYLRHRYGEYLNASYSPYEIYIQSSQVDRTIMSAECNLAGLYPPNDDLSRWNPKINWQPIPIHAEPITGDRILKMDAKCPRLTELYYDFLNNSAVIKKINTEYKDVFELLTNKTGRPIKTPEDVDYVYDVLYITSLHYGVWPEWAPEGSEILKSMRYITRFSFQALTYTEQMKRLKGGPLLSELLNNFNYRKSGTLDERRKVFMYSGHDTTVAVLLNTIGVFDPQIPPYTSMVMLELWQDHANLSNPNGTYNVKMFLRNDTNREQPYVLNVPNCNEPCSLEKFHELMKPRIPVNWEMECQSGSHFYDSVGLGVTIFAIGGFLIFVIIVVSVCLALLKKRHSVKPPSYPYLHLQMEDEEA